MPITGRAFIRIGGSGLAGAPLLASSACSRPSPPPAEASACSTWEQRVAGIEKRLRESMAARKVPGASVDDATVFSAQSMSKPVFAYRVMKLCEQGALDLDAPLTRHTRDLFATDFGEYMDAHLRRPFGMASKGGLPLIWTCSPELI